MAERAEHKGPVDSLDWSPDGDLLASGGMDGVVRLWQMPALLVERVLLGHRDLVRTVAWSPNGLRLASGSDDRTIRLWRRSGEHDLTLGGPALSDEERMMRQFLEAGSRSGPIDFYASPSGVAGGHTDYITALAWSADGAILASGGYDQRVLIWKPESSAVEQKILEVENHVYEIEWPVVPGILTVGEGRVVLLLSAELDRVTTAWMMPGHVTSVTWEPGGEYLATACPDATNIHLLRPDHPDPVASSGHVEGVRDLAWSPVGSLLASVGNDRTLRLWELER